MDRVRRRESCLETPTSCMSHTHNLAYNETAWRPTTTRGHSLNIYMSSGGEAFLLSLLSPPPQTPFPISLLHDALSSVLAVLQLPFWPRGELSIVG